MHKNVTLIFEVYMKLFFIFFITFLSVRCSTETNSKIVEPTLVTLTQKKDLTDFYLKYPLLLLAENSLQSSKYDSTIYYCNRAEDSYGKMVVVYEKRGLSYSRTGRYEKAIEQFSAIINGGVGYMSSLNNRGMVYYKNGKYDLALDDFFRVEDEFPRQYLVYVNIGNCFYEKNDIDKACIYWNKAYENGVRNNKELNKAISTHCQ